MTLFMIDSELATAGIARS